MLAIWIGERRWVARGGIAGEVSDLAIWAVPFGLVGGRLYHVMTDWQLYFGEGRNPVTALYVWRGGLGIWGAIALGAFGLWLGARTKGIKMLPLIDALAPGVLVAQAVGRWGNWFNQELYGRPTDLPWGLEIDVAHRPSQYLDQATFHPAFLYECLWNLAAFALSSGSTAASASATAGWPRSTSCSTRSAAAGSRTSASTTCRWTTSWACGSTCGPPSCCSSLAAIWFIWSAVRHPGREEVVRTREPDVEHASIRRSTGPGRTSDRPTRQSDDRGQTDVPGPTA